MPTPFIMVAPNGARRGKGDHPLLPISTDEIVATAIACHEAGADALHLHVRDDDGQHSLDAGRYLETLDELCRSVPNMRVQITTESAGIFDVSTQLKCLEHVQPDWASISVREMARDPHLAQRVYATCAEHGIEVQHILYDTKDAALLRQWQSMEIVRAGQDAVLFVLGRYAEGQISTPRDLDPFLSDTSRPRDWMVCAFGPDEHSCLLAAAKSGGAVRVGFENSLMTNDGQVHSDNAASVSALRNLIERSSS